MQKGKTIYYLIQSLNKSEKRYFKRLVEFGTGKKETNATLLFDVLDQLDPYDEEKLKKQLKKVGLDKQIRVYQTLLFDQIMRSLRMTRQKEDLKWKVRKELTEIEILFERNLVEECARKVNITLKLCNAMGFYGYLQELHGWQYKLMINRYQSQMDEAFQKTLEDKVLNAHKSLKEAKAEMAEGFTRRMLRNDSYRKKTKWMTQLQTLMLELDQDPPILQQNFPAWSKWMRAKANLDYLSGDFIKAAEQYGEILSVLEKEEALLNLFADNYLSVINNYLNCCKLVGRSDNNKLVMEAQYWEKIGQISRLPIKRKDTRDNFNMVAFTQQLLFSMHYHTFEKTQKIIEEYETWLDEKTRHIATSRLLISFYNVFAVLFVRGHYRKAKKWLNRILDTPGKMGRTDIRNVARLFQLVLHFELNNVDLIENLLPTVRRFLNRAGDLEKLHSLLLSFFQKTLGEIDIAPSHPALTTLKAGFSELMRLEKKDQPFGTAELNLWVESKIQGVSLSAWYTEKRREYQVLNREKPNSN